MRNILSMYRHLPKNILILFFVKFINAFGDFVVPFMSLFLTAKFRYSAAYAASIVTATVLIQIPGALFGGSLADRWNQKSAYILVQSASAFCLMLCAFISNHHAVVILLLISTFFSSAVRPILNAFVYDLVDDINRKTAYSFLYLGINIGVAVGPLLSGFLYNNYLMLFFLGDALTSYIAVCLVAFFIHLPKTVAKIDTAHTTQTTFLDFLKFVLKTPALSLLLLLYIFLSFMYAQHSFSLPLLLKELYDNQSAILFGTLMSVNAITVVVATPLITYYTRNKSLLFNISCAGICLGMGFGLLSFPISLGVFIPSTILWTFGEILMSTNIGIYVLQHVDISMRTRSSAFQTIVSAVGKSFGIFSMGIVITHLGIRFVWPIILIMGICTFFAIRALDVRLSQKKNSCIQIVDAR
ncbi:MAG: MFS transporter [Lachnotalea sp.]